jgi:hypothetical protein
MNTTNHPPEGPPCLACGDRTVIIPADHLNRYPFIRCRSCNATRYAPLDVRPRRNGARLLLQSLTSAARLRLAAAAASSALGIVAKDSAS